MTNQLFGHIARGLRPKATLEHASHGLFCGLKIILALRQTRHILLFWKFIGPGYIHMAYEFSNGMARRYCRPASLRTQTTKELNWRYAICLALRQFQRFLLCPKTHPSRV